MQSTSRLRLGASDYFFSFCRQILPQIEERVERQLLEKFKATLETTLEKEEIEQAYLNRKDNLAKIPEKEEPGEPEPKKPRLFIPKDEYYNVIQSIHGDSMSYHTYADVGRYTVFPAAKKHRMFPSVMFGRYFEDEFSINETLGIQTREEALRLANDLARLTLPHERKVNYSAISAMDNHQVKAEILQDETNFVAVYQDFSLALLDYIEKQQPYEAHIAVRDFFAAPGVFDGFVNVLVQELRKSPVRPHLCDPAARQIVIEQMV